MKTNSNSNPIDSNRNPIDVARDSKKKCNSNMNPIDPNRNTIGSNSNPTRNVIPIGIEWIPIGIQYIPIGHPTRNAIPI